MLRIMKDALLTLALVLYGALSPALAQSVISVKDILDSPEHFYNQSVRIKGKVIETNNDGSGTSGTYILETGGMNIPIVSEILPEKDKTYKITVQIQKGPADNPVIFKEISRTKRDIFKYAAYIFGGLAIIAVAALVFGGSGTVTNL